MRPTFHHAVTIRYPVGQTREILKWLDNQGHVLRETMIIGASYHKASEPGLATSTFSFVDPRAALMFNALHRAAPLMQPHGQEHMHVV